MHIGLDFDNTIVTYDTVFHRYALEKGLIDNTTPADKTVLRDTIRLLPEGNDLWTELQGVVYGLKMAEAEPADGVLDFLSACSEKGFELSIISHKTEFPVIGPRVNLRNTAKDWIKDHDFEKRFGIDGSHMVFVGELEEKLYEIGARKCGYFIDDLIEVLAHPGFPLGIERILYSRSDPPDMPAEVMRFATWGEIKAFFIHD